MKKRTQDAASLKQPGKTYRIRVSGILDPDWSRRTHGMTVEPHRSEDENSFTELFGTLQDEAALMGVLDALYGSGARLLNVELVNEEAGK